jgi:hypothetical protein
MHIKRCFTNAIMVMLLTLSMATVCFGQSYWKKTYEGQLRAFSDSYSIPTADGNFLILSYTIGSEFLDFWLLKIKPNGDTIWLKTYERGPFDNAQAIIQTVDSNFLILGRTYSSGSRDNMWLLKINQNGDSIWTKTYRDVIYECEAQTIIPTADSSFLILGSTQTYGAGSDIWLSKINPNGDISWTETYGGVNSELAQTIIPTADGNFLILGQVKAPAAVGFNIWLLKVKPNGDTIWTKTYGGENYDVIQTIIPTTEDNFLILGETYSVDSLGFDIWLSKIKPNGDPIWTKTYGGVNNDFAQTITPTADGKFLILGETYLYGANDLDIWLLKIEPNGDTIWTKTYGNKNEDSSKTIIPTMDGNFLMVGTSINASGSSNLLLFSIIADQYAYKNSLFTFKIPTYGIDSLNFGYVPLKTPAGMTVSPGGTISWTPKTDSVYMDHAAFIVVNDAGGKDTLTFNIFVNSDFHTSGVVKPFRIDKSSTKSFDVIPASSGNRVKFLLSSDVSSLCIYDVTGKLIDKVMRLNSKEQYTWPPTSPKAGKYTAGKYFARVSAGKSSMVKPFLLVR